MIIPRLGERLSCMIYRRKLEMDMEELKPELTILRSAADELKNSIALKKLLAVSYRSSEMGGVVLIRCWGRRYWSLGIN